MRLRVLFGFLAAACLGAMLAGDRSAATEESPLSRLVPQGALLYLEAKDFSSLLAEWNGSPEKAEWLKSDTYAVFSKSRLFLRLKDAGDQFASAAGIPPDMKFVSQVAGGASAVAIYDIGKLEFLYITRLGAGHGEPALLAESRSNFETRNAGGKPFFIRKDPESGREVAFTMDGDYLLLATREDLLAHALELLGGSKAPSIEGESWWTDAVAAAGRAGDLRLVLNLAKIVPSPYFRTYWIQRNITDTGAYRAAVSDLILTSSEYREERVLLKTEAGETSADAGSAAVADLARLVPADASVYQIVSGPSPDASLALLETKLLAPHAGPGIASKLAPQVQLTSGVTGGGGDLETRIDQAPFEVHAQESPAAALKALLTANPALASLNVQATEIDADKVFVRIHTGVVLAGASDWNEAAVRQAIEKFVRPELTASGLGTAWQNKAGHAELSGLWPLALAVRGKYLFVADDARLLETLTATGKPGRAETPAVLVAGFHHATERGPFVQLVNLLDGHQAGRPVADGQSPEFFSGNMAGLSRVLSKVASEKVVIRDAGGKMLQTVTFEWEK